MLRLSLTWLTLAAAMQLSHAFVFPPPATRYGEIAQRRAPSPLRYVPSPVDPGVIVQQLVVVGASGGAAWYWANVIVPSKRTELAKSKRDGQVDGYLADLELGSGGDADDKGGRSFERWLFADWLAARKEGSRGTRKSPALPLLQGKWNSGDNPVLVATALILAGVIATSLGERMI